MWTQLCCLDTQTQTALLLCLDHYGNLLAERGFKEIVHFVTTFFKLCMLLGMDITFLKTTAHKLGRPLVAVMQKKSKMAATGN